MPRLGIGSSISKSSIVTPGIVTDNLVLKHMYGAGEVVPVSDGAASFDGTDDYINTGFIPDYIHTNATVAFWVNMNDVSITQVMGQHGNQRWYHGFNGTKAFIGVQDSHNSGSLITITPTPVAGQWLHYCVTAIDGTATVYIDGVAQGTMSYTQDASDNPDKGYIMGAQWNSSNGGPTNWIDGYICNVGQWSTGLTQPQIKSIMNKNYAGLTDSEKTNLVSWWNLSADANDSHGSNNGTLT